MTVGTRADLGPASRRPGELQRFGNGRTCTARGCDTVLSTYNAAMVCWMHQVTKPVPGGPLRKHPS